MMLPIPSNEQQVIIDCVKDKKNVQVDAISGSGKTLTSLLLAKSLPNLQVLLITYNSRLKLETRDKIVKYELSNIEAHSFHSFGVRHYNRQAYHNLSLAIKSPLKQEFNYNLIIIDEAQDLTYERFEFVCKIIKDNNSTEPIQLCVVGDQKQCIYDFGDSPSDSRFLIFANKIFSELTVYPWIECKLSTSYRITQPMADFVNSCMLQDQRLSSAKGFGHGYKPRYLICNAFVDVIKEYELYTNKGYAPHDMFILAYSIKRSKTSFRSPIIALENQLCKKDVKVYASTSDDEVLNEQVIKDKLVISTFHSTKGLERKIVIVFGFDKSFYKYYQKKADPSICSNLLYVATTRASEHLTLIHHCENDYLPFLVVNKLQVFCKLEEKRRLIPNEIIKPDKKNDRNVTDMCKHLPPNILEELCEMLEIVELCPAVSTSKIPNTIEVHYPDGKFLTEYVADITGDALPIYLELIHTRKSEIVKKLTHDNNVSSDVKQYVSQIDTNSLENNPEDILKIATAWHSHNTGYLFKLKQILKHDWITMSDLVKFREQFEQEYFSKLAEFECRLSVGGNNLTLNYPILGRADCIDLQTKTMWEFKCTAMIQPEHKLQLALYMYLHMQHPKYKNWLKKFYIYNLITGQKVEIKYDKTSLDLMVSKLLHIKYGQTNKPSYEEFINECQKCSLRQQLELELEPLQPQRPHTEQERLRNMKVSELKLLCKENNHRNYSKLNKEALITKLISNV